MMPSRRYWLSVWRSTRQGRFRACKAEIAARSSMRLLVVWASPPLSSFLWSPKARIAPQPPGPGLPEQAPSVWITTCGSLMGSPSSTPCPSSVDPVVAHALDRLVEAQLAEILDRVLRPHQCARRNVEPVGEPGQQEPQRRPARQERQQGALLLGQRPHRRIALQQRPALGHVVGMVDLEAPGIEADR